MDKELTSRVANHSGLTLSEKLAAVVAVVAAFACLAILVALISIA
jgi:hypothetical protein